MKLYTKIFLCFFLLIAIAFCFCGTWMIKASFGSALKREIQVGMSRNELYRTTFRSAADSVPADYFITQNHSMKEIVMALKDGMDDKNGAFCLYDKNKKVVYSSDEEKKNTELLKKADRQHRVYQITHQKGAYTLRVVSYMVVSAKLQGYYVETQTDIRTVYDQRRDMLRMYHYIVCVVLLCCVIISMILSYLLTYRIRGLSLSAKAFADGDMDRRARVRGRDEVAVLAGDFNQMADSLQEKIAQLKENVEAQEAFTAAFAHELKTPLTSIIGYAELIRSMVLSKEEQMEAADYIYSQGKRLESLSYRLLELFVLQQGTKPDKMVEMQEIGRLTRNLMMPVLEKQKQTIRMEMNPGAVPGDKELLISLLCNLIDNARKASGTGQEISIYGKKKENGYEITVVDYGKGIPSHELDKIFAPFYMVDKSRSRKEGGAGLGMALCAEIIRLHGAVWEIESLEGVGTTVILFFHGKEMP